MLHTSPITILRRQKIRNTIRLLFRWSHLLIVSAVSKALIVWRYSILRLFTLPMYLPPLFNNTLFTDNKLSTTPHFSRNTGQLSNPVCLLSTYTCRYMKRTFKFKFNYVWLSNTIFLTCAGNPLLKYVAVLLLVRLVGTYMRIPCLSPDNLWTVNRFHFRSTTCSNSQSPHDTFNFSLSFK